MSLAVHQRRDLRLIRHRLSSTMLRGDWVIDLSSKLLTTTNTLNKYHIEMIEIVIEVYFSKCGNYGNDKTWHTTIQMAKK